MSFHLCFNPGLRDYRYEARERCARRWLRTARETKRENMRAIIRATVSSWSSRLEWQAGILSCAAFPERKLWRIWLLSIRSDRARIIHLNIRRFLPWLNWEIEIDAFSNKENTGWNFISVLWKIFLILNLVLENWLQFKFVSTRSITINRILGTFQENTRTLFRTSFF